MNSFEKIITIYNQTQEKPDKKYSTLPTVVALAGNVAGKTVLDVGCGSGFFTCAFARAGAERVIGIDNSPEVLRVAVPMPRVEYFLGDIFVDALPQTDVLCAPYVLNYAPSVLELKNFFARARASVQTGGRFIAVCDMPDGRGDARFGALKKIIGARVDGAPLEIELWVGGATHRNKKICTLRAIYFTRETISRLLHEGGFSRVNWHAPIISPAGMQKFGAAFWDGYADTCELGFLVAE